MRRAPSVVWWPCRGEWRRTPVAEAEKHPRASCDRYVRRSVARVPCGAEPHVARARRGSQLRTCRGTWIRCRVATSRLPSRSSATHGRHRMIGAIRRSGHTRAPRLVVARRLALFRVTGGRRGPSPDAGKCRKEVQMNTAFFNRGASPGGGSPREACRNGGAFHHPASGIQARDLALRASGFRRLAR